MPKNSDFPIIFCNPYDISKIILTSTRKAKLKHLDVWNKNKKYVIRKEIEALTDLERILKSIVFDPCEGWLVRKSNINELELSSNKGKILKLCFSKETIIGIDENGNEYTYKISCQHLIQKKEKIDDNKFVIWGINYDYLVYSLSFCMLNIFS